ncbi:small metal-binding protein SmbP [Methylocystis sp. JAN1]|uniref:small metal-binding protein SmbP n=1 Tax=Methylocystis sp. JAN1 TaxID=3397211 RepID=UPI003FA328B7
MNRRVFAVALSLAVGLAFTPKLALAESHHLAEAVKHTKEAIDHGKMGHADVLVTHAEAALKHAKQAEAEQANEHTKEGITHLEAAIDTGKKKDAPGATKHAEEALTHLEAAEKK